MYIFFFLVGNRDIFRTENDFFDIRDENENITLIISCDYFISLFTIIIMCRVKIICMYILNI